MAVTDVIIIVKLRGCYKAGKEIIVLRKNNIQQNIPE